MNKDNFKTKLCKNWDSGYCKFKEECHFAHGTDDMRELKPKECWFDKQGICKNGLLCSFTHKNSTVEETETKSLKTEKTENPETCWGTNTPKKNSSPFSFDFNSPSPFRVETTVPPATPKKRRGGPLFPIKNWGETCENEPFEMSDEDVEECYQFFVAFDNMMKRYGSVQKQLLISALQK